jgi:hypothetical protein
VYGLDFVNDLEHDELVTESVWDLLAVSGVDVDPNVHLEGPSFVIEPYGSNRKTATMQRIGGLFPGVTYRVRAVVITSTGNTRNLWSHIRGIGRIVFHDL